VKIELSGGIGNQLFQYSLGKCLQSEKSIELTYVSASPGMRETIHGSKLKDFNFGVNVEILKRNRVAEFISKIDRYFSHRFSKYNAFAEWIFRSYTQIGVGFDEKIMHLQAPRRVRGYFQSYLFAESIKSELISEFELIAPSECFLIYAAEAKITQPIIVHLRRGDYAKLSSTVGILGANYYFNGIKSLNGVNSQKQIWIFSDDKQASLALATQLEKFGIIDIKQGFELTDSETLKLMSMGSGIVIANSTFSWWSAFLGNYGNNVVAPQKWYRGLPDPKDLIPKNWKLIESTWE
jgi:hypothetical protein